MKLTAAIVFTFSLLAGCSSSGGDNSNTETADRQISARNAETLLREISAIVNEEPIEAFMQQWQSTFSGGGPWLDFPASSPMQSVDSGVLAVPVTLNYVDYWENPASDIASEFTDYACNGGGVVRWLNSPTAYAHILDNCAASSATHSGEVLRVRSVGRPFIAIGHYKNLKIVDAQNIQTTLSGRFRDGGNQLNLGKGHTPAWFDVDFNGTQNNEAFSLTGVSINRSEFHYEPTNFTSGSFTASIQASFDVAASWSQQTKLSVAVDVSLTDGPEAAGTTAWDTGTIVVNAPDGSWMKVEIDAADTAVFSIQLENNEVIGPVNWVDGYQLELSHHW